MREHAAKFGEMARRAFQFHTMDLDTLRNKYSRAQIDLSRVFIARMKRKPLVNAMLAAEFGGEAVMDYISQCKEWDECKNFVEGKT